MAPSCVGDCAAQSPSQIFRLHKSALDFIQRQQRCTKLVGPQWPRAVRAVWVTVLLLPTSGLHLHQRCKRSRAGDDLHQRHMVHVTAPRGGGRGGREEEGRPSRVNGDNNSTNYKLLTTSRHCRVPPTAQDHHHSIFFKKSPAPAGGEIRLWSRSPGRLGRKLQGRDREDLEG